MYETNFTKFNENLINWIKTCLNIISSLSNLAKKLSDNEVKREIAKENEGSKNQKIIKKHLRNYS